MAVILLIAKAILEVLCCGCIEVLILKLTYKIRHKKILKDDLYIIINDYIIEDEQEPWHKEFNLMMKNIKEKVEKK